MATHAIPAAALEDPTMHDDKVTGADDIQLEKAVDANVFTTISRFASLGKWDTVKLFKRSVIYAMLAGMGAFFDGFAIVVPNSIVANPGFIAVFGTLRNASGALIMDPQVVGGWGGIQSAGQILGMWTGPFLSDRFGRKANMGLLTILLTIAAIIESTATDWRVYLVARFLAGAGTGVAQGGVTVYISEVAQPQIRGSLLSYYSIVYSIGGLLGSISLKVVNDLGPPYFRRVFYAQFAFLAAWLPCLFLIPESPWYYARRHEHDKAKASMVKLYGGVSNWEVDHEYSVLSTNIEHFEQLHMQQKASSFWEMFKGTNARRTFISWFPLAFQQFCGLSLVLSYNAYFFSLIGLTDPFLASLIIKIVLLLFTIVSFYTVETVGRRPSMLIGGSTMAVAMLVMGILGSAKVNNGPGTVAIFCIFAAIFAMSASPLGWTFVAETSTPRLRAKTAGFAAGCTAVFGLLFNYTVPLMLANPGPNWGLNIGYFWFGLGATSTVIMYFVLPETKGRSYSELDQLFERRIPARKFASTKTSVDELKGSV